MSDSSNLSGDEIKVQMKVNVQSRGTWMRLVYMLVLAIAMVVAVNVMWAMTVVQFVAKLFTGEPFGQLCRFGAGLATYLSEIAAFLTFASDHRPFPFSPFPEVSAAPSQDADQPA